jgi:hypothetical protein
MNYEKKGMLSDFKIIDHALNNRCHAWDMILADTEDPDQT